MFAAYCLCMYRFDARAFDYSCSVKRKQEFKSLFSIEPSGFVDQGGNVSV